MLITEYSATALAARREDPCLTPGWLAPTGELDQEAWQGEFIDPVLAMVQGGVAESSWPQDAGVRWRMEWLVWLMGNESQVSETWRAAAVELAADPRQCRELLHFIAGCYKSITLRPWESMNVSLALLQELLAAYPGRVDVREALAECCFYFGLYKQSAQCYAECGTPLADERLKAFEAFVVNAAMPASYKASVLVLSHSDQHERLAACLREVREKSAFGNQMQLVVGLNGGGSHSLDVARRYGANEVVCSDENIGIELYKALFAQARGALLFEMDDDVLELPAAYDETARAFFSVFHDYGFLGLNPIENDLVGRGGRPDDAYYEPDERHGLVVESGPVGGWCAALPREHFQAINGFYGVRLSRPGRPIIVGEEPQIWRKLWLRGTRFGIMRDVRCLHGVKSMADYARWRATQQADNAARHSADPA